MVTQFYNFSGVSASKVNSNFVEEILKNADVRKIVIINHSEAEIHLKSDRLLLDKLKKREWQEFKNNLPLWVISLIFSCIFFEIRLPDFHFGR